MDIITSPAPSETRLHFLDYWRIIRIRKTVILSVFILVVLTAAGVTMFLQPSYMSFSRIKVEKDQSDISFMEQRNNYNYDPYFIQTEYEVLLSSSILYKVIENLNLNVTWGQDYAGGQSLTVAQTYILLKRLVDIRPARNTSIIEIRAYSRKKEEAARIANEIAKVYHDYRLEQRKEQALRGIKTLEEEYEKHDAKVQQKNKEVDELRITLGINDLDAINNTPTPSIDTISIQRLEGNRIEADASAVREEELLRKVQGRSREELRQVIPTLAPDSILTENLLALIEAESKLVALRKDYGPEHPEVQKVVALVAQREKVVNDRIDGFLDGQASKASTARAWADKLAADLEKAKTTDRENYLKSRPYYEAKRQLEELQQFGKALSMKIRAEITESKLPTTSIVTIIDKAEPALKPVLPNKVLNITLGVIVGLIVGIGLAFFIEYLDTSVKTIDDVERALQAPVLGVIPQNVGKLIEEGAESPHAEAYRVLRTNLLFSRKDEKLNSMAVVSAGAGEGKSTTLFNLATVFAQNGQRVIVVDSDLRRPSLHKFTGVSNTIGLTNYLLKQNTLDEVIQTTNLETLHFLPSGKLPSSSMGILSSAAMRELITELKLRYDFVFFDSPPIMGVSDASILASEVDMTVQVIQYRRYPQPMNIRAKQLIEKVGGNHMGIVLNNINMSQDESYYYYSGYYHEYYSKHDDDGKPAKKSTKA